MSNTALNELMFLKSKITDELYSLAEDNEYDPRYASLKNMMNDYNYLVGQFLQVIIRDLKPQVHTQVIEAKSESEIPAILKGIY